VRLGRSKLLEFIYCEVKEAGLVEPCSCCVVNGLFNNLMQSSSLFITF